MTNPRETQTSSPVRKSPAGAIVAGIVAAAAAITGLTVGVCLAVEHHATRSAAQNPATIGNHTMGGTATLG